MKLQQHIYYELLLIIGSVFVFRGLWTLMDRVPVLNDTLAHAGLLIFGIILTIYGITKLTHKH